jgi:hypothetical protein
MTRSAAFRVATCTAAWWATACAATSPSAPPPEEVLLAVNSTEASLSIVPVNQPSAAVKVPLGGTSPTPVGVSALNGIALVPMGFDNSVAVVDLKTATVSRIVPLPANSGATGSAVIDDSIGYVANPNRNTVTRVNYLTGDTASVAVGVYPQNVIYLRGKLFVLNGNLDATFSPAGPSWLTVIDPVTNQKTTSGPDSIGLVGPGNAGFVSPGGVNDPFFYVMNTGNYFSGDGALSIINPVTGMLDVTVSGFGTGPGNLATDGGHRLFISSYTEGVMEFNTDTRSVVLGAGQGIAIPSNSAVAVDSQSRIYAISTGPCAGGQPGVAHVLRPDDLTESSTITLGECPVGVLVTKIPA